MPSPFPGMDPYIESEGIWRNFHARAITYCSDLLGDRLPENYFAAIDEVVRTIDVSADETGDFLPDVGVRQTHPLPETLSNPSPVEAAEATLMTLPRKSPLEVRERQIQIVRYPEQTLIAIIEILSPTNKNSTGFLEYASKRRQLLDQPIHLIEIDLLVFGQRPDMDEPWPPGDYFALVARAETRPKAAVYSWSVRQPLPTIPIPLREPDADVSLPLNEVVRLAYDRGRFARSLDYRKPLRVPLHPDDLRWATELAATARMPPAT